MYFSISRFVPLHEEIASHNDKEKFTINDTRIFAIVQTVSPDNRELSLHNYSKWYFDSI